MPETRKKTVLVIGGTGFIGQHVVDEFVKQKYLTIATYRNRGSFIKKGLKSSKYRSFVPLDACNLQQTKRLCDKADTVINCAGLDGSSIFKRLNMKKIYKTNVQIAHTVFEAARTAAVANIMVLSSTEVNSSVYSNERGYAQSKKEIEQMAAQYAGNKMRVYLPRLANVYGPGDYFGKNSRVIPTFICRALSGFPLTIWGVGTEARSFIYVKDVAKIITQLITLKFNEPFDIMSSEYVSLQELARHIKHLCRSNSEIIVKRNKSLDKNRTYNLHELTKIYPQKLTELKRGLKMTVAWYQKTYRTNFKTTHKRP